ncbi:MAG: sigma-54 dependent transcriptional regulator [Acidobacteriota bacterium]
MKKARVMLLNLSTSGTLTDTLRGLLESTRGLAVETVEGSAAQLSSEVTAGDVLGRAIPDAIFLIPDSGSRDKVAELLQFFLAATPTLPILVAAENGGATYLLELLKLGAADFILPPLNEANVLPRLWRLLRPRSEDETLVQGLKKKLGLQRLVGSSPVFVSELKKIPIVAKCDVGVLITGETGTGKELFARAIHYLSPRSKKPFVPVNCSAIPAELAENELFGHERGAFTGAESARPGLIGAADGGTLFLDEIDATPLLVQAKLLRFLQDKEYRLLGSTRLRKSDVRVVAASNSCLEQKVEQGTLRQDLYYRLNVIPFVLPPLRKRIEDIPRLARHFLKKYTGEFSRSPTDLSAGALQKLMLHRWPGNVRELEHVIERALVLSDKLVLRAGDMIFSHPLDSDQKTDSFQAAKAKVVAQFERQYIHALLSAHRGNITRAADAARKNRRAFWELIRKHQIDPQVFRSSPQ